MSQSRLNSLLEKVTDTFVGFLLYVFLAPVFFSLNGIHTNINQDINVVVCFTLLSIVRGYFFRRFFNRKYKVNDNG